MKEEYLDIVDKNIDFSKYLDIKGMNNIKGL